MIFLFISVLFTLRFGGNVTSKYPSATERREETEVLNTLRHAKRKKLYEPEQ